MLAIRAEQLHLDGIRRGGAEAIGACSITIGSAWAGEAFDALLRDHAFEAAIPRITFTPSRSASFVAMVVVSFSTPADAPSSPRLRDVLRIPPVGLIETPARLGSCRHRCKDSDPRRAPSHWGWFFSVRSSRRLRRVGRRPWPGRA